MLRLLLGVACLFGAKAAAVDDTVLVQRKVETNEVLATAASFMQVSTVSSRATSGEMQGLKVAYVVFVSAVKDAEFKDVLAVQAHGLKQAASNSRHNVELVALVPQSLPEDTQQFLEKIGFSKVVRKPLPVDPSEIDPVVGKEVLSQWKRVMGQGAKNVQFLMADETLKYWGMAMAEYDRVLVLDSDVMVLDPMDELMERKEDFVGSFDHGLDKGLSTIVPPAQGGFLLFRPNEADFKELQHITREGDFRFGWRNSGIGYCYGGTGPDGLLAYFYHKDALSGIKKLGKANMQDGPHGTPVPGVRMYAADRLVYDVVLNEFTRQEMKKRDRNATVNGVKSIHFTGDCQKPWRCSGPDARWDDYICEGMTKRWWAMRDAYEAEQGLSPTGKDACKGGRYVPFSRDVAHGVF